MATVEIECTKSGAALRLSSYGRHRDDPHGDAGFVAQITSDGLDAASEVYDVAHTDWTHFFDDLAAHWRGWVGAKEVASIEDHLQLSATTDSTGHITLQCRLRSAPAEVPWLVTVSLHLEAGQLSRLAEAARHFFI